MHRLVAHVQPYAWGSKTAIAELRGVPPSGAPEAELWMGAHEVAPSSLEGHSETLAQYIESNPTARLGARVRGELGDKLPFLLKVLAAAEPLSLQAHPTKKQAEEGFAREELAGIPHTAPHRNYKDRNHKPELLCAMTPFFGLCGFRRIEDTRALVTALECAELRRACDPLFTTTDSRRALHDTFVGLVAMKKEDAAPLILATMNACKVHASNDAPFHASCAWAQKLAALYPGDVGAVVSLLLNLVRLEPGEAMYLHAGNLHAYLEGVGIEIMASSDNVLRGGLTKKHVDVPELSRVLDFESGRVNVLSPQPHGAFESVYVTDAREFELSRVLVTGDGPPPFEPRGPEILLVTEGEVRAHGTNDVRLSRGECAFVAADEGSFTLRGAGVVHRAKVPQKS
jgi:mannose-6-phosphate isomerase